MSEQGRQVVARNRKARHEYDILEDTATTSDELRLEFGFKTFLVHPSVPPAYGGTSTADELGMGIHGGLNETSVFCTPMDGFVRFAEGDALRDKAVGEIRGAGVSGGGAAAGRRAIELQSLQQRRQEAQAHRELVHRVKQRLLVLLKILVVG